MLTVEDDVHVHPRVATEVFRRVRMLAPEPVRQVPDAIGADDEVERSRVVVEAGRFVEDLAADSQ